MTRARRGLTLLELVVALAVTGIALASGHAAFGTLADRRAVEVRRSDVDARAAGVRRTLRDWLADTRLTLDEATAFHGFDDVRASADGPAANDDVTGATTALGSGITRVRLFVDRVDTTAERGLVAELTEWRGTRTMRVELAREVDGLDLRYLSGILGERQWLPSWLSNTTLPAAVELRLHAAPGATLHPLLALPATVVLEGGR